MVAEEFLPVDVGAEHRATRRTPSREGWPTLRPPIITRVEQLVADHIEPVRSTAYNELGGGRRAVAIATRWLRPKLDYEPRPSA
jgi:hypothetical protein